MRAEATPGAPASQGHYPSLDQSRSRDCEIPLKIQHLSKICVEIKSGNNNNNEPEAFWHAENPNHC